MEIIGHRGVMGLAPENSAASFSEAIKRGVDWIELDVRLSRDNQLIVIHDEDLERLAGVKASIAESSKIELDAIPLHSKQKLLTLEQALAHINDRVRVDVEMKTADCAKKVATVLKKRIEGGTPPDHYFVSSFVSRALVDFHHLLPEVPTARLRRWWPFVSRSLIDRAGLHYVGLRHNWVHPFIVRRLQKQGLGVYAYTFDEPEELARLEQLGLTMVVRNSP